MGDLAIGADLYPKAMKHGISNVHGLIGQAAVLGWIERPNNDRAISKIS